MASRQWVRSRSLFASTLAGAALLTLCLGPGGCKKEGESKPSDEPTPRAAEAEKKAAPGAMIANEPSAKAPGQPLAASGFAVFPADTEFVLNVSVSGARKSALWSSYGKLVTKELYEDADFKQFMKVCGFDPIEKIKTFLIGGNTSSDKGVIVIKGFTKAEVKACAEKISSVEGGKVVVEGNLIGANDGKTELWAGWLDEETLVASTDVSDRKYLEERLSGAGGIDKDAAFMDLLKNVDSGATVWFAMIPREGSPAAIGMAQSPAGAPVGMFGSILLDAGVALDAGARFKQEAEAKQLTTMATSMLPAVKKEAGAFARYIDKVSFKNTGRDIIIQAKLSEPELNELIAQVKKQLGGLEALFGH